MRVYLEPYGCTLNKGDARLMARGLLADGHTLAGGREEADAVVLVTCCVIEATANNMVRQLGRIRKLGKPVVVAGCMAKTDPRRLEGDDPGVVAVPPERMEHVPEALASLMAEREGGPTRAEAAGRAAGGGADADTDRGGNAATGESAGGGRGDGTADATGAWKGGGEGGGTGGGAGGDTGKGADKTPGEDVLHHLRPEGVMVGGIVPIASGCLGNCSYCITRLARGGLRSVPPDAVADLMAEEVSLGHAEIKVTAQDTGAYGADIGTDLPSLLELITTLQDDRMEGRDFRIRVGMMNPDGILPMLERLVPLWGNHRLFRFLHLPVQSGDDSILRAMGRRYTAADFERVVARFRSVNPDLTLSTDVIVGYPGEGEEEWRRSVELVRRVEPDVLNITRFSPRPGTPAWDLRKEDPHPKIAKERSRELSALHLDMAGERMRRNLGRTVEVMVTEAGLKGTSMCRTPEYIPVVIPGEHAPGKVGEAEVTGFMPHYLKGRVRRWMT